MDRQQLTLRNRALAEGRQVYDSRTPCYRGHVGARNAHNYECLQCNRHHDLPGPKLK